MQIKTQPFGERLHAVLISTDRPIFGLDLNWTEAAIDLDRPVLAH